METNFDFQLVVNRHSLISSINELMGLITMKSNVMNSNIKSKQLMSSHEKLRDACGYITDLFSQTSKESKAAQSEVIKKIYKTLTTKECIQKMTGNEENEFKPSLDLFKMKNDNSKIITIIPGVNVGLIISNLSNDELNALWGHLYVVFISTVNMVAAINRYERNTPLYTITIPQLQLRVSKMGLTVGPDKQAFNPFVGLTSNGEITAETLISNTQGIKGGGSMIGNFGLESLIDMDKLNEEMKELGDEEENDAAENILSMFGGGNDPSVNNTTRILVKEIISDLKKNGLSSMMSTAEKVSERLRQQGSIDINDMQKTSNKLRNFMVNGEKSLQEMKDKDGNPVGADLMNGLRAPLQFVSALHGEMPRAKGGDDEESVSSKRSHKSTSSRHSRKQEDDVVSHGSRKSTSDRSRRQDDDVISHGSRHSTSSRSRRQDDDVVSHGSRYSTSRSRRQEDDIISHGSRRSRRDD